MAHAAIHSPDRRDAPLRIVHALAALVTLPLLTCSSAYAATSSTTFTVNANVLAVCTLSATNVNFGNYDATSATPTDTTSTITALCTSGQAYTVALDAGISAGATVAARKMTSGTNVLSYGLYTDSGHTTLWGDGTLSTTTVAGTGTGANQALTVYGRIPISQHEAQGSYADDITATLTY
ncbi:MAG: Csu type fimbrial protein [Rhodanobacter sp.]